MKEMLEKAKREGYAVIAPSIEGEACMAAAVEAAEAHRSPIIINVRINAFDDKLPFYIKVARRWAEVADVPVAVNLDHGKTFDENCRALYYGYTSIMVDRSALPYEENVAQVKQMVDIAHAMGVSVEGELGELGWAEGSTKFSVNQKSAEKEMDQTLTDPDMAKDFVERTGLDFLAVSLGNKQGGFYKDPNFVPHIDFDRLVEIRDKTNIPLVLHGGSGVGVENLAKACRMGICKVNVGSELRANAAQKIIDDPVKAKRWAFQMCKEGYREALDKYFEIFGCEGKAD